MTNQLTVRIDVENGIAVVSRSATARSRTLAVAAATGSQVLAFTAAAQPIEGQEDPNPIVYPEFWMGVVAGAIVGVIGTTVYKKKKKD